MMVTMNILGLLPLTLQLVSSQKQQPMLCVIQVLLVLILVRLLIEISYHDRSNLHMIGHYGGLTAKHSICLCTGSGIISAFFPVLDVCF